MRASLVLLAVVAATAGCSSPTQPSPEPAMPPTSPSPTATSSSPSATASPTPGPGPSPSTSATSSLPDDVLRLGLPRMPRSFDPVAAVSPEERLLVMNVYQRLMTTAPDSLTPRPQAAQDCVFTGETEYTCTLRQSLRFHDGSTVEPRDVKFSIERAIRLGKTGTAANTLSSLASIDTTPDTVVFRLKHHDSEFPVALMSPVASIVSRSSMPPTAIQKPTDSANGSGDWMLRKLDAASMLLVRAAPDDQEPDPRGIVRVEAARLDSRSAESAMRSGTVDVVTDATLSSDAWQRVLSGAAGIEGFGHPESGRAILTLRWSATSALRNQPDARARVADAARQLRTHRSLLPPDRFASDDYAAGGGRSPAVTAKPLRVKLAAPGVEAARAVSALRASGVAATMVPSVAGADLVLEEISGAAPTSYTWLASYLRSPLKASRTVVAQQSRTWRTSRSDDKRIAAITALQKQAARDQVVLPISLRTRHTAISNRIETTEEAWGPGWELMLSQLRRTP